MYMSMVFAKKNALEALITDYITPSQQKSSTHIAQFRKEITAILHTAQLREEHVYDAHDPLVLLVSKIRKAHNIPQTKYTAELTSAYVETLKHCLGAQTPFAPSVHPFVKPQPATAKETPVLAKEEIPVASDIPILQHQQKPSPVVETTQAHPAMPEITKNGLTQEDAKQLQDLYATWSTNAYVDAVWSKVISMEGIQEVIDINQRELQQLAQHIHTLLALPIPQLKDYHTELHLLAEECQEMQQELMTIHLMEFKSREQQPRKKFTKKCIDRVRFRILSICETLLAGKGREEYKQVKSAPTAIMQD